MARILVVDDSPLITEVFAATLRAADETYEVDTAEHGVEALAAFERAAKGTPYDLVVTDLIMPEMDGFALIETLLRWHPGTRILVVSGGERELGAGSFDRAIELGALAAFQKPMSEEELTEVVWGALAGAFG